MKLLKKAQVSGLQGFILSIVTVAIVLAIGLIVLNELYDATKVLQTSTVTNETITISASGAHFIGQVSQGGLFIGASGCRNASGITENVLTLGTKCNATSSGAITVMPINNTQLRVDYTHYTPTAAYNSTGSIITKMATVPTWIGIIIIVALAFIVLSFFIGKRQ